MAKVLVTVNEELLRRIDRIARSRGLTRSAYLSLLAEQDSRRTPGPGATTTARGAMHRLDELFAASPAGDSTAMIRSERDAR
jgi:hypothetical protein